MEVAHESCKLFEGGPPVRIQLPASHEDGLIHMSVTVNAGQLEITNTVIIHNLQRVNSIV